MAGLTSALCTSFKVELLEGDHDFNNGADAFKVALLGAETSGFKVFSIRRDLPIEAVKPESALP